MAVDGPARVAWAVLGTPRVRCRSHGGRRTPVIDILKTNTNEIECFSTRNGVHSVKLLSL